MYAGDSNYIVKSNKRSGLTNMFSALFQGCYAEASAHDLAKYLALDPYAIEI